tara:strand:+ start:1231 stop:1818 length:588 start_codon:yes stop_codon:yes gene_type:complete
MIKRIEQFGDPIDCALRTVFGHFSEEEEERLAQMDTLQFTKGEKAYEDVVKLASAICGAPISLISIIGRKAQTFKASTGLLVASTPRSDSFCVHTLNMRLPTDYLVVQDALLDPRFVNNALVTGPPYIRFYCGFPLRKNGYNIGAVCVIDTSPRTLTDAQIATLAILRDHLSEWVTLRPPSVFIRIQAWVGKLWK